MESIEIRGVENGYMVWCDRKVWVFGTIEALFEWLKEKFDE